MLFYDHYFGTDDYTIAFTLLKFCMFICDGVLKIRTKCCLDITIKYWVMSFLCLNTLIQAVGKLALLKLLVFQCILRT